MSNSILVTGATGKVGSHLIKLLKLKRASFAAMVRTRSKAEELKGSGVEAVLGDFEKPATLEAALAGKDVVFLLTPLDPRMVELQGGFVRAAQKAGVGRVVKLSALGAGADSPVTPLRWHGEIERAIENAGLAYTHIRPHSFMQNTLMFAESVASQGAFYAPYGNARISMVDVRDVSAVAAAVLTGKGHEGKAYDVTGPEALSMSDVADRLARATRKPVAFNSIPPEEARRGMIGMGMPEWLVDGMLELLGSWRNGDGSRVTPAVQDLTQSPARTFDEFAQENARAFGGA